MENTDKEKNLRLNEPLNELLNESHNGTNVFVILFFNDIVSNFFICFIGWNLPNLQLNILFDNEYFCFSIK